MEAQRRAFGPGIISGAADDDPGGIATYSIAGAQCGTGLLWLAPVTWPLMAAVQSMCARIGMVTGGGLMDALRRKIPRPLLLPIIAALFIANTFNIGADLAAMSDAAELLTHIDDRIWVIVFGIMIAWPVMAWHYATIARNLKWLVLALFAYVITAFVVKPDWSSVAHATIFPQFTPSAAVLSTIVAVLGTTISPYLFFWQASAEVEEEKAMGRLLRSQRIGASAGEISFRKLDIGVGTFVSNLIMFFIMVTTASTLHRSGILHPETSAQVASALEPIAGRFAVLLYTAGIIGTGALAIPTLAASAAYAFAEMYGWSEGMNERPSTAPRFYAIFAFAIAVAVGMHFTNFSAVRALYWSAVLNGLLAPFLLVAILAVASDARMMAGQPSSRLGRSVVGVTIVAMFAAGIAMFVL